MHHALGYVKLGGVSLQLTQEGNMARCNKSKKCPSRVQKSLSWTTTERDEYNLVEEDTFRARRRTSAQSIYWVSQHHEIRRSGYG